MIRRYGNLARLGWSFRVCARSRIRGDTCLTSSGSGTEGFRGSHPFRSGRSALDRCSDWLNSRPNAITLYCSQSLCCSPVCYSETMSRHTHPYGVGKNGWPCPAPMSGLPSSAGLPACSPPEMRLRSLITLNPQCNDLSRQVHARTSQLTLKLGSKERFFD